MPPPVVTDATTADAATLLAAAAHFLPVDPPPVFTRCTGGVNNVVFYVDRPGAPRLILRIYNNGRNTPRVQYEHAVLDLLSPLRFSFATPRCLPALAGGASFVLLPSGAACCVTECIPGGVAENRDARAIGRATAELVRGMAGLRVPAGVKAVNPLYRNFWDAHWNISPATFAGLVEQPAFDAVRGDIDFLRGAIGRAEALIARILAMDPPLPAQLINADLHTDNVLVEGGAVSGVLDFEFAAVDWRVMELVVGCVRWGVAAVFNARGLRPKRAHAARTLTLTPSHRHTSHAFALPRPPAAAGCQSTAAPRTPSRCWRSTWRATNWAAGRSPRRRRRSRRSWCSCGF